MTAAPTPAVTQDSFSNPQQWLVLAVTGIGAFMAALGTFSATPIGFLAAVGVARALRRAS